MLSTDAVFKYFFEPELNLDREPTNMEPPHLHHLNVVLSQISWLCFSQDSSCLRTSNRLPSLVAKLQGRRMAYKKIPSLVLAALTSPLFLLFKHQPVSLFVTFFCLPALLPSVFHQVFTGWLFPLRDACLGHCFIRNGHSMQHSIPCTNFQSFFTLVYLFP